MTVVRIRRDLRRRIAIDEPPEAWMQDVDLVRSAAARAADGDEVFVVLADLVVDLTRSGHAEILLPPTFDETFWKVQDSATDFAAYLMALVRVDLPTIDR